MFLQDLTGFSPSTFCKSRPELSITVKVTYWSVVMEFIKAIRKFGIFKIGKVWYFLPSIHFAIKIKNKKAI